MTVQDRLRERFEIGLASVNEVDRRGILYGFTRLCDSMAQSANVSRLLRAGKIGDAFLALPPRIQLQAVEFVEGKPLAKPRPATEEGDGAPSAR